MYLFSFDYPPNPGGIARLCSQIARALAERGALEAVLTAEPGWRERPAGVREVLFSRRRILQELQAARFLAAHKATPVLCARWWPEAALVEATGGTAIVLAHGTELLSGTRTTDVGRRLLRRQTLLHARVVIANSHYTSELVQSAAPGASCAVVPPAVDCERFFPGDRSAARVRLGLPQELALVATVGRVQAHKGHATILRALALLPAALRGHVRYVVAGNGPSLADLRSLAARLGVDEQVHWLGHVPEEVLPDVYRAVDLHALVSERMPAAVEGFGMVSLEAQACGIAALGSDSGGIGDSLVADEGGFIVPAGDAVAVSGHLERLIQNRQFYHSAGLRGLERVTQKCTWSHYVDALLREVRTTESELRQQQSTGGRR